MTIGTSRTVAVVALAVVIVGCFLYYSKYKGTSSIASYEECRAAGYPIMESYPEQCRTPDGRVFVNEVATSTPGGSGPISAGKEDKIRITSVEPDQIISSPLVVSGEARGYWYFEASFPVELIDGNGKQLVVAPAQAKGEWMTTDFVPFSVTLNFSKPITATGTLIVRNDNPSGLLENQEEARIPVRFSQSERVVKLYYYNPNLDKDPSGNVICSSKGLVPVNRTIPATQTPLQDTLRVFLRGELTAAERGSGIVTEFPLAGVTLTKASLSGSGALTVTLADPLLKTSGGSCRVQVLRAQIEATARQFENVKSVSFVPATLFQP